MHLRDTMWLIVLFDLPVKTRKQVAGAQKFVKRLKKLFFVMLQKSVYIRHGGTYETTSTFERQVERMIPPEGEVCILRIRDSQYEAMKTFYGGREAPEHKPATYQPSLLFF